MATICNTSGSSASLQGVNLGALMLGKTKVKSRSAAKSAEAGSSSHKSSYKGESEGLEVPDAQLVQLAKQGDQDAFRQLVTKFQNRAFAIAYGILRNNEDAEDIVQDAFVKAYRNLGSFQGKSSFYTWLYRIVFNLSIDLSRKRYRKTETKIGDSKILDAATTKAASGNITLMTKGSTPEDDLYRVQLRHKIQDAIDELSPEHRAVIMLREIEGLSYAEISDVVGCSKGTVMSRLHHARKKLQQNLQEHVPWRDSVES